MRAKPQVEAALNILLGKLRFSEPIYTYIYCAPEYYTLYLAILLIFVLF